MKPSATLQLFTLLDFSCYKIVTLHRCKRSKECNFCEPEVKDKTKKGEEKREGVEDHKKENIFEKCTSKCALCDKLSKNRNESTLYKRREHVYSVSEGLNFSAGVCE